MRLRSVAFFPRAGPSPRSGVKAVRWRHVEPIFDDEVRFILLGASLHRLTAPQPNEDQQTGRGRIREADAAHARSSPFLSAISGRYISDGENRR